MSDRRLQKGDVVFARYTIKEEPAHDGSMLVYPASTALEREDINRRGNFSISGNCSITQFLYPTDGLLDRLKRWETFDHPHILPCFETIREDGEIYAAAGMYGEPLAHYFKRIDLYGDDEESVILQILDIAIQCAEALQYLHKNGVIHGAVKPNNLYQDKNVIRLCGLDLPLPGIIPSYHSPEQINGEVPTTATDVWSFAAMLMNLFDGNRVWFKAISKVEEYEKYFETARIPIPVSIKNLLRKCFEKEPTKRPSINTVFAQLLETSKERTGKACSRVINLKTRKAREEWNEQAIAEIEFNDESECYADLPEHIWEYLVETKPKDLIATYNLNLYKWIRGRIPVKEAVRRINGCNAPDWQKKCLSAELLTEAGCPVRAYALLRNVRAVGQGEEYLRDARSQAREIARNLRLNYASIWCGVPYARYDKFADGETASDNITVYDEVPPTKTTVCEETAMDEEATVYEETVINCGQNATRPESDNATVMDDEATEYNQDPSAVEKGRTLLNTYRIESNSIEGGMGKVWRVRHTGWNTDLAMKQPKAKFFQTEKHKANFIRECEAWINLGLHPHIVSCYYVREIGGIPTIFSEWMDGGSLKDIIGDGSLYTGSEAEQQERILDIAIQFARGLHYAHECRDENGEPQGLIHQDVKPDNLLLTKEGEAKVADFGIAKARATLTMLDADFPSDGTMFSQNGGYTPAYCSMEQKNGEKLTRRTDIYSWAVSVMEMFLGERLWESGVIAGAACESYFPEAKVAVPEEMKALLKECLNQKEALRPRDFAVVEKRLLAIYKDTIGSDYGRTSPQAAADTADSLNNRALSFLDIGKPEEAEKCWEQALSFAPYALEANYNYALHLWHTLRIDDAEVRARIDQTAENNKEASSVRLLSAQIYMERGNREQALKQIALAGEFEETAADALRDKALNIPAISVSKSISAHEIVVSAIALSPDERYLVTGGGQKENQVRLWDAQSLRCLRGITLDSVSKNGKYHYSTFFEVTFVAVSKDARLILSYDNLLRLHLWETASGKCLKQLLDGELDGVAAIGFSDDEKTIWAATLNGTVRRWDVETFACIGTKDNIPSGGYIYPEHRGVFSADGRLLLRKDKDDGKKICLWNTDNGRAIASFALPAEITAFHMDAGCQRIVASCDDGYARVFDLHSKQIINQMPVAENKKMYIVGNRLYVVCRLSLKLYEINTGKCQRSFGYSTSFYLTANTAGDRIYAENGSGGIYVCSIPALTYRAPWALSRIASFSVKSGYEEVFRNAILRAEESLSKKDIHAALAALQEARAVPGYENARQYLELNKSIGRYCRSVGVRGAWPRKQFDNNAYSADFLTSERILLGAASTESNGQMLEIAVENGAEDNKYKDSGRVIATCVRMDGKYFLAQSQTDTTHYFTRRHIVALYDALTGEKLHAWNSEAKEGIVSFALAPAGNFVAIGTLFDKPAKDSWGRIAIYELPYGKLLRQYAARGNISSLCFSHDGKRLFTSFYWWNQEGHEETECTETVTGEKLSVKPFGKTRLFPDGQTAISTEGKTNMVLWKTNGLESIRRIGNYIYDPVAISPDCRFLLMEGAWSTNHTSLELWDVETLTLLRTLKNGQPQSRSAAFSPNGQMLLFGPNEWKQLWDIDHEYEFPGWADWDEGARPYLEIFLALHPEWTEADFSELITDLQNRGYGWLRPEGVRAKLQEISPKKKGLFSLFGIKR